MASPNQASLTTQLQNAVELLDNLLAAQTLTTDVDAYVANIESDFASEATSGAESALRAFDGYTSVARAVLAPVIQAWGKHLIGAPETDADTILTRMFTYWHNNSITIQSRAITYGSPSAAGGNTGDGSVLRLTTDESGYAIEATNADVKTLRCIRTQNTGRSRHQELFELRGSDGARGLADLKDASGKGSGDVTQISTADSTATFNLLRNGAFSSYSIATGNAPAAGSPLTLTANDTITNWTVTDLTAIDLSVDDLFKIVRGTSATGSSGRTLAVKLALNGDTKLTQTFETAGITQLDPARPYYYTVAMRRRSSADGTLTMTVGSQSTAVTVSSLTNDQWTLMTPTLNQNLWPANFDTDQAEVSLELASNTTGSVEVSEIMFVPFNFFDGLWYLIIGGETPWALDDEVTITDSIPSDSKIQKWISLTFGRYLPHSGTPSIADPT